MSISIQALYARQQSNLLEAENRRKEVARLKGYVFCGAPSYGERIGSKGNDSHTFESKIVDHIDLISKHEGRIKDIEEERFLAHQMIFELKNTMKIRIVEEHCFEGKAFTEIAEINKRTIGQVYKLYKSSMKDLKRIREENVIYSFLNK